MKPKALLSFFLLLVFLGVAILVYQSDSIAGNAVGVDDCVQLMDGDVGELSGLLVLESRTDDQPSFVLDLATGEKEELRNLTVNSIVGPSEAGLLTYYDFVREAWMLVDLASGLVSPMEGLGTAAPIAWMDYGQLLIGSDGLQVLDLESGELQDVLFNSDVYQFQESINWSSELNWDGYTKYRLVPGPDLRFVAYVANGEPGALLVLWDQELGQEVEQVHWGDMFTPPQWASDGRSFVTSAPPFVFYEGYLFANMADDLPYFGGNELVQVGVDGSVRRLTTFTSNVKAFVSRYRWSPDGRRIAFSLELSNEQIKSYRIAILSVEVGEITAFCLPSHVYDVSGFPVWSPNGKNLALTFLDEDRHLQTYILEIESGTVVKIRADMQVSGWWGN